MENPIQYRNTDNPSQIGGLATTRGGLSQQPIVMINPPPRANQNRKAVVVCPPGRTATGGLMKTLHRSDLPHDDSTFLCACE